MTQTPATEQADPGSTSPLALPSGPIRANYPVLVFALLWPVQLIYIGPVLSAVGQAQIAEHFHTAQIAWFTLLPTLVGMLLTPLAIKVGDVYGKRRIMLGCVGVSVLGALLTALAPTYSWMLFGRGIGAFFIPMYGLVFATVREIFPRRRAATATGLIGGATGGVLLFTPLLASVVLDSFHFRALLWLLVAFTAVGFLLILAFVPETPRRVQSAGFDRIGAVLLGGCAAVLAYALGEGIGWGWSSSKFLGMIVVSAVLALVFVLVERTSANPLLDVRVLARREVATVLGSTSLAIGASFTMTGFVAILLAFYPHIPRVSDGLDWSATHYALIALPGGVLMLIAGLSTGALIQRIHPKPAWWIGAVFLLAGMIWTAYNHQNAKDIIISWLMVGIGSGLTLAVSPVLVLTTVTAREQGQIGGMQSMLINLANALGIEVASIMLNRHAHLFHGTAFYVDPGFRGAYLILAAMVVLGLLVTFAMPRLRKPGAEDESHA